MNVNLLNSLPVLNSNPIGLARYKRFIKSRSNTGGIRHHIYPRCLFSDKKDPRKESKDNFVYLTNREHFIAHLLLSCAYPNHHGLSKAAFCMGVGICASRVYEILKQKSVQTHSKWLNNGGKEILSVILKERLKDPKKREIFLNNMKKKSPEFKELHKRQMTLRWQNTDFKNFMVDRAKKWHNDPSNKEKHSKAIKDSLASPLSHEIKRDRAKKTWDADHEARAAPLKTKEFREIKRRQANKQFSTEEARQAVREKMKLLWQNPEYRERQLNERAKRKDNPEFSEAIIRGLKNSKIKKAV